MKPVVKNSVLAVCVVVLALTPLFISKGKFSGADDLSTATITSINPNYKPWFAHIYQPASSEVESFLFATQAALGSGIVCFYLGYKKGQQKKRQEELHHD
ncbi:energy-coupling factor ABC transporter substrate-binding protein [Desulfitobacterium sp.]|uniref:energy-coupling factor ABC transporter substrate-binding protein n=1 Tax=Desulfitobacterium sp. TaxID=49981 RepID=UPI002BCC3F77|nr:energy-coupling factor ABC transporter substrate-binding protein [Desulfitobacterium sp.]HVJ49307.1 energy-coupling factor ABC transporter substrate-binding protein [Desulfitobacterium sp.]